MEGKICEKNDGKIWRKKIGGKNLAQENWRENLRENDGGKFVGKNLAAKTNPMKKFWTRSISSFL